MRRAVSERLALAVCKRTVKAGLVLAVWVYLALLLSACGSGQPAAGAPTGSAPTTAATAPPTPGRPTPAPPTPPPAPSPTLVPPPTFTPLPAPTQAPLPTAAPAIPLRISAQLDPPTPRAGTEFVLRLAVANDGSRAAHGVYIATSGPWDRWTVLDVQPSGMFGRDAAGWHVASPIDIPPAETRNVEVHIRADEPAEEQLTFAVREAEAGEVVR
jgi:hypothetical protein